MPMTVDLGNVDLTTDGRQRVSSEKPEGARKTVITSNFCDRTTWYWKSKKQAALTLVDQGAHTVYKDESDPVTYPWIDNAHGKYFKEDFLLNEDGQIPRMVVYVDGVAKVEDDPHTEQGDYTVDYTNGTVTFATPLGASAVVTADAWSSKESTMVYGPDDGNRIKLDSVEIQMTEDVSFADTIVYQTMAYNPFDPPHRMPYGDPDKYKSMLDLIAESNRAYPQIMPTTAPSPIWRDLAQKVTTLVWDFNATIELPSAYGGQIWMSLEHDTPFGGTWCTVALYGRQYLD